jgi:hypothetical protein
MRGFQVDIKLTTIGALDGSTVDSIVGSGISTLGSNQSLFQFILFSEVDDISAVVGTTIFMPLNGVPGRVQEDGEKMEDFLFKNIVMFCFVLIILYSLKLEYGRKLLTPSTSGRAG